jgi:hypothetical protein
MEPIWFTATLTDEKGRFLEKGHASLTSRPDSLCFKSSFVPLMKIGTLVSLIRTSHDRELESFRGEVFASSRQLLKITSIPEEALTRIRNFFAFNTDFEATLKEEIPPRLPFPWIKPLEIYAAIYYISLSELKFQTMDPLETGTRLLMNVERSEKFPFALSGITLEVSQIVDYGGMTQCCLCWILSMPETTENRLKEYLEQQEQFRQKKEQPPSLSPAHRE